MKLDLNDFISDNSSSVYLYEVAKLLKDFNYTNKALDIINNLLNKQDPFKYYFYNQLLHFKAILLSAENLNRFDEAIDILKLLYGVLKYHLQEPEVLTLLGSNYKRKAFYKDKKLKKDIKKKDINYIVNSIYFYNEALKLNKDKYYNFLNILYLEKILTYHNNEDIDEFIHKKSNDLSDILNSWKPQRNNWWEMISYVEINILLKKDLLADEYFDQLPKPTKFQYNTSRRQMEIYNNFCPDDTLFNSFFYAYNEINFL